MMVETIHLVKIDALTHIEDGEISVSFDTRNGTFILVGNYQNLEYKSNAVLVEMDGGRALTLNEEFFDGFPRQYYISDARELWEKLVFVGFVET